MNLFAKPNYARRAASMCFRLGLKPRGAATKRVVRNGGRVLPREASREEQYGRYLDCGPENWDDR